MDTLFSIYNFRYTYFLEIKRRYTNIEKIPLDYKYKLNEEMNEEVGNTRRFIQTLYIPWFILTIFSKLFFLPIILSLAIVFTNLFYKKAYISPLVLLLNLIFSFMIYLFVGLNLILGII
jgi:hypothetical protein